MIDCDRTRELMSDFLENDIDANDREEVSAHLSVCPACAMIFRKSKAIISQMSMLNNVTVSVGFDGNLAARIQDVRRHPHADKVRYFARGAAVGAAAAGILFVTTNSNNVASDTASYSGAAVGGTKAELAKSVADSSVKDSTSERIPVNFDGNIKMVNERK
jgi:predicted anti-sigma-YlaC factor YlaD